MVPLSPWEVPFLGTWGQAVMTCLRPQHSQNLHDLVGPREDLLRKRVRLRAFSFILCSFTSSSLHGSISSPLNIKGWEMERKSRHEASFPAWPFPHRHKECFWARARSSLAQSLIPGAKFTGTRPRQVWRRKKARVQRKCNDAHAAPRRQHQGKRSTSPNCQGQGHFRLWRQRRELTSGQRWVREAF